MRCALYQDKAGLLSRMGTSRNLAESSTSPANLANLARATENFRSVWEQPASVGRAQPSRYSDGVFNVLYTATTNEVAMAERLHWAVERVFKVEVTSQIRNFFLYTCHIKGKCLDYTRNWKNSRREMVHPTDYSHCHAVARDALDRGADYLIVPSARKLDGCCVPVFNRDACTIVAEQNTFDVSWDSKKGMPYTHDGKAQRYVKIDEVYGAI